MVVGESNIIREPLVGQEKIILHTAYKARSNETVHDSS